MPRLAPFSALLPLATLAACNSGPSVSATNASGAEVAAKMKAAGVAGTMVSPGRWEATMTINSMSAPNMPPQFAAEMKKHMGQARTFVSCLTPEEAKAPKEDFFGGMDKSCRYEHFTMGGGTIDAVSKCSAAGGTRTMTMKGTYSADAYRMTIASSAEGAKGGPMAGMAMNMTMDAKRAGACTGKEEQEMMERMKR